MEAYFYKEGKRINYSEMVEVMEQLIRNHVIEGLDDKNIQQLYIKTWDTVYKTMKDYLTANEYKVVTPKQMILTAKKLKLIEDQDIWNEVIDRKDKIEKDPEGYKKTYQGDTCEFIKKSYFPQMKLLRDNLKKGIKKVY